MRKSDDKKSFQLYNDYIQHFSLMSDEDAGKLIKTIFSYVNDQPFEDLEGLPMMAFSFIRSQLDRDKDAYDAKCEANRRNGSLGGRPRKDKTTEGLKEEPKKPNGIDENQTVLAITEEKPTETPQEQEPKPKPKKEERLPEFEKFWAVYPRKEGKGEAYKKYVARIKNGWRPEELEQAASNYRMQCERDRTEKKYIKHPKTFLSDTTPFVDYLPKKEEKSVLTEAEDNTNPFL